jgi:glutamine synthetase
MDTKELVKHVKNGEVEFILSQYTGALKNVNMPVNELEDALDDGVWFDGSSKEGFVRIQEWDMNYECDPQTKALIYSAASGMPAYIFPITLNARLGIPESTTEISDDIFIPTQTF